MKVLVAEKGSGNGVEVKFRLLADSSLLPNDRPFFLPDFAPEFRLKPAIVVRIDRLGKHIAERFAHRYYHQVAAGAVVEAVGCDKTDARYGAFEGALVCGEFVAKSDVLTATMSVAPSPETTCTTTAAARDIDALIAMLSTTLTLKMGDLIVVGATQHEGVTLQIGQRIVASLNDSPSLTTRIK